MIIPSSLFSSRSEELTNFYNQTFKNVALRNGIVIAVYDIEDQENISKVGPEYDVMAIEQVQNLGINTTIYKNCLRMDSFGGGADYFQAKLRSVKDTKKTKSTGSFKNETGSIVALLCVDGVSEKALIVGGVSNPSKQVLTKEKGIHLEGEYNGINYQINKEGELTVTFRSATNDDGTPKDEKAGGSFLKIDKTGSFELNDNNKDSVRIDKTKQTITLNSEKDTILVTNANCNITSKQNTNLKVKDLIAQAEGKITFDAKSPSVFKCAAELTFEAPTVKITGQDMIMAQADNIQILGNQVIVGNGAVPAVIPQTIYIGTGNVGAPVFSESVGPYSSSVLIGV